ncbi:MAG: branched-chain amino acid transport system substrate-binding protein [Phormidesmis priestleyi Ana]|uniref:Branched-chain amino acid transport system substrate-binding protein n=1 Tax=Phormidesmis priestleyi Ana TaxID=1666911 RepID=A0A0P7ZUG5_9CYAN|nr:MAG: branched-chain amino acid transport system substrate-binding protein [Phormidesmis priestleyi Ana]
MSQENNNRFALFATLLAIALVGGISLILWAITNRLDRAVELPSQNNNVASSDRLPESVTSRVSAGEEILFPDASDQKQTAIEAIAQGDYASAITTLNAALEDNPNDPEAFIYRSNARIAGETAVTVAVVAPVGEYSNIGLEILRGAAQAQYDINRSGGIDGTPVRLVLVNDENNPEVATEIAQTLVEDPSVLGVVGHYGSDVTLATVPIYEAGELVTITPVSSAVELSGVSPYLYRTVPSDSFAAAALAAYMLYYRDNRQAAVYYDSSNELSSSLKEEFKSFVTAWGGDIVAEYDLSQTSFDPNVQEAAQTQGADTLMLAPSIETLPAAAAVIEFNKRRLPILGSDELYNRTILAETGPDSQALTVAVPWHLLSRDSVTDFVESSRALWEGDVSWRTATTYDAMIAIAAGLQDDLSRAGLKTALDNSNFSVNSATGPINFLPSGDRRQVDRLVLVERGTRSGTGYDFVPFTLD